MSLLNLLPSGITGQSQASEPTISWPGRCKTTSDPASGWEVSKISKLMSFSVCPGSMCINEGCAATMGHTKLPRRQLLNESTVTREQAASKKHLAWADFSFSSCF